MAAVEVRCCETVDGARGEGEGADVALVREVVDYVEDDVGWEVGECDPLG